MRRKYEVAGGLLLLGLAVGAGYAADDPPKAKAPPAIGFVGQDYGGNVTAVTKNSITIERPEFLREIRYRRPGGIQVSQRELIPAVPPKKFAVSEELAAGKVPTEPRPQLRPLPHQPQWTYHLSPDWMSGSRT
jgi:hypothetical protein